MAAGVVALLVSGCSAGEAVAVPSERPGVSSLAPLPAPLPDPQTPPPPLAYSFEWVLAHGSPAIGGLTAQSGIVVDLDRGTVIWARTPFTPRSPASLTKLMTAMIALDMAPPSAQVTVPPELANPRGGQTLMGVSPGQVFSVADLLGGMFAMSGNDAAETLARTLAPRDQFLAAMNAKAAQLGLAESNFTSPSGLDGGGPRPASGTDPAIGQAPATIQPPGPQSTNHSSAYDMAVIAGWLLTHYPAAIQIAASRELHVPATDTHPRVDALSVNNMLFSYPGAYGLKTGFTFRAGYCMVTLAQRYGRNLLEVSLGSNASELFADAARLLDYGWGVTPAQ